MLVGQRSPLEAKSIGQNAVGDLRHGRKRLAGTEAGRGIPIDGGGRVKIVALDAGGPRARFDRKDGTQRDRSAGGTASAKLSNILGILTKGRVSLSDDAECAPEEVEIVDVDRSELRLESREDVFDRHVEHLRLCAVDVGVELWCVGAEAPQEADELRSFRAFGDNFP